MIINPNSEKTISKKRLKKDLYIIKDQKNVIPTASRPPHLLVVCLSRHILVYLMI